MKIVQTSENATGTRYDFSWTYRKLNTERELINVMAGKSKDDIYDVQSYQDPVTSTPCVAFQIAGEGLFQGFKESFRYACEQELFTKMIHDQEALIPWHKKIIQRIKTALPNKNKAV